MEPQKGESTAGGKVEREIPLEIQDTRFRKVLYEFNGKKEQSEAE